MLEQAAQGQPADVEINEHLGDAYFAAGRRVEARFAWKAASVYAEGAAAARIAAKMETGLTPQLAAPLMRRRSPTPRSTSRCMCGRGEPDGYHRIETIFAFCEDGDVADRDRGRRAEPRGDRPVRRRAGGRGATISCSRAARALGRTGGAHARQEAAGRGRARRRLGRCRGGAAACSAAVAGDDRGARSAPTCPPACSAAPRAATGRGDLIEPVEIAGLAGTPVLLVNPGVAAADRRGVRGPGTASTAARSATGKRAATTSRRRRAALVPEIGDGARRRSPAPASRACRARARPASGSTTIEADRDAAAARIAAAHARLVAVPNQASLTQRSRPGTGLTGR